MHTYYTYIRTYTYLLYLTHMLIGLYAHMLIAHMAICSYAQYAHMSYQTWKMHENAWKMHDPHISYLTTHAISHIPNISYLMRIDITDHIYHISYLYICSYAHSPHGHMLICPTCPYAHISHLISHISRSHISYLISHMRHEYRSEVGGRGGSP